MKFEKGFYIESSTCDIYKEITLFNGSQKPILSISKYDEFISLHLFSANGAWKFDDIHIFNEQYLFVYDFITLLNSLGIIPFTMKDIDECLSYVNSKIPMLYYFSNGERKLTLID